MHVNELHFLIEYKILKGFVCWCRERAQLKYEARSRNWIWLDKFTRYVRIKFGPKCNKVLNVRTFGPKCNKPPMEYFICVRALSFIADIHTEMLKWQRLHQRILWPIFMAYCGLADVNQRLFIFQRIRSRSTGYKPLYWCAFGIKLTEVKVMKMMTTTSLFLYHSLRLFSATDFDDILVWSVLKLTLYEPNYKERKSTDLFVRQIPGSEAQWFFVLSSLARCVWVCMKYIHMLYWPSVRSRRLDIGRVLLLPFHGPRQSRGP